MTRVLLRLMLIVSLVMNGVSAPWAMAKEAQSTGHEHHLAMASQATETQVSPASECRHGGHAGMDHGQKPGDAPSTETERSCCDGPNCSCGCMLPPMLARFVLNVPVLEWTATPTAEPSTRAVVRRAAPPFRPPAV
jgi:hypothetical protein